jgi:hypothetical protein
VERLAREQYGLVLPGETGYTVEGSPELPVPAPRAVADSDTAPDDRSMLQRFWDWMTGRDLDPDD